MVKAMVVLGCILIAFIDYGCCIVASSADRRTDEMNASNKEGGMSDG